LRIRAGLARFIGTLDDGWIVLFDPLPGEPDLGPLVDLLPDRLFALTRTPPTGRMLTAHSARGPLERHPYGFCQPMADAPQIAIDEVVAVCVPGLAFDRRGGRLGFGAGYYDRFLATVPPEALRIGVSDGFIVERIPTDEHDVTMTHLATEIGVMALPLVRPTV
jgi:5-formyltetrahydrofolate cyclo-ligase